MENRLIYFLLAASACFIFAGVQVGCDTPQALLIALITAGAVEIVVISPSAGRPQKYPIMRGGYVV